MAPHDRIILTVIRTVAYLAFLCLIIIAVLCYNRLDCNPLLQLESTLIGALVAFLVQTRSTPPPPATQSLVAETTK